MHKALPAIFLLSISASVAMAADNGTYRPGSVYYSAAVSAPDLCAAQCTGDAQCRSWNFVKLHVRQTSGICELNSNQASPVSSPLSISGINGPARRSSKIIPAGTNTVRVGNPEASITPSPPLRRPVNLAAQRPPANQTIQTRQVIRRPVPVKIPAQSAAYRNSPVKPAHSGAAQPQPRRAPSLPSPIIGAKQQARPSFGATIETHRTIFTPYLDEGVVAQPVAPKRAPQMDMQSQSSLPNVQGGTSIPTIAPPAAPQPLKYAAPTTAEVAAATIVANNAAPAPLNIQRPPSLFGSLYDDLNEGVSAPKVLTPSDIPDDPDAPIATVSAVPTTPITIEPF